ncbi:hypothetical protein AMATHDRAFT_657 [Amanita thiersii Skay4041]|uniref:Nucleolus and neural progenitor protein-like N-terminal domain-containing protein n=1 Tax=Amanita thiersii Skay4041 TaxID=703135 RepID=A0A2A9P1E6_9AGAR|nr:hypothetical protein AMATHDRAFT_657 [Amanita thiersii Skay4041]
MAVIERSLVPQSSHSAIDSILKGLKLCSRRIQQALSSHSDELLLLHRIYYKSKNQHRVSLFWRRLGEVRRYSVNLEKSNIVSIIEPLRASFFGPDAINNPKLLKGSWTHVPSRESVEDVSRRLNACHQLLEKMQDRLLAAYRSFTLAMQTGAFIQLLLVLAAITSRIRIIALEIKGALEEVGSSLQRFLRLDFQLDMPPVEESAQSSEGLSSLSQDSVFPGDNTPDDAKNMAALEATSHQAIARVVVHRKEQETKVKVTDIPQHQSKQKTRDTKKPKDEIDAIFSAIK